MDGNKSWAPEGLPQDIDPSPKLVTPAAPGGVAASNTAEVPANVFEDMPFVCLQ